MDFQANVDRQGIVPDGRGDFVGLILSNPDRLIKAFVGSIIHTLKGNAPGYGFKEQCPPLRRFHVL